MHSSPQNPRTVRRSTGMPYAEPIGSRTPKPRHRYGRLAVALVMLLALINVTRPLPTVAAHAVPLHVSAGTPNISWPASGEAAVGAVGYGVLATNDTQTPTPTASVAKIITALAVLHEKPLAMGDQGPTLTMTANDVARYQQYVSEDGSVVQITEGEQLSEYQMLQAMLLPSGNNIADSLAIWAFGSLNSYLTYANQLVAQLGMQNTKVANDASGFDPATVSTAADLVQLGQAALQNPVIASIVSQTSATLPEVGTVQNVDTLIGTAGIEGIKTGNNDQDTGCFLSAASRDIGGGQKATVITAIMDEPSLDAALSDTIPLVQSTAASFVVNTPVRAGQAVATYTLPWGASVQAVAQKTLTTVTWAGTPVSASTQLNLLSGGKSGAKVGELHLTAAGKTVATAPVVLRSDIAGPGFGWRLTRH